MHSNIQQLEAEVARLRGLLDRSRIGDYVGQNRVGEDWASRGRGGAAGGRSVPSGASASALYSHENDLTYTCGCGIYVHPSRRNPKAIHISDCVWHKAEEPEVSWREEAQAQKAEVERLRAALGECYSDLCGLEPLLTDTEQARLLSSAISWCKYLKQPEWNERVDRLRAALEELVTYQNGSPLPSYDEGWANAMRLADEALRGGEK